MRAIRGPSRRVVRCLVACQPHDVRPVDGHRVDVDVAPPVGEVRDAPTVERPGRSGPRRTEEAGLFDPLADGGAADVHQVEGSVVDRLERDRGTVGGPRRRDRSRDVGSELDRVGPRTLDQEQTPVVRRAALDDQACPVRRPMGLGDRFHAVRHCDEILAAVGHHVRVVVAAGVGVERDRPFAGRSERRCADRGFGLTVGALARRICARHLQEQHDAPRGDPANVSVHRHELSRIHHRRIARSRPPRCGPTTRFSQAGRCRACRRAPGRCAPRSRGSSCSSARASRAPGPRAPRASGPTRRARRFA